MTNRALMEKTMSELDFARAVVDLALSCGWKVKQEPVWRATSRKHDSAVGFPDLVLARKGQLIFAELKAERGRVSKAQEEWMAQLRWAGTGVHVYVWKPSDWDEIVEVLR